MSERYCEIEMTTTISVSREAHGRLLYSRVPDLSMHKPALLGGERERLDLQVAKSCRIITASVTAPNPRLSRMENVISRPD